MFLISLCIGGKLKAENELLRLSKERMNEELIERQADIINEALFRYSEQHRAEALSTRLERDAAVRSLEDVTYRYVNDVKGSDGLDGSHRDDNETTLGASPSFQLLLNKQTEQFSRIHESPLRHVTNTVADERGVISKQHINQQQVNDNKRVIKSNENNDHNSNTSLLRSNTSIKPPGPEEMDIAASLQQEAYDEVHKWRRLLRIYRYDTEPLQSPPIKIPICISDDWLWCG